MTESKLNNLFFALWPDESVRAELVRIQHSASVRNGRLHHPDDLHLTLVFLGRVAPEQIECVRQMAASIAAEPFSFELTRTGQWKRPRILWCSPDQAPALLCRLVHDLQQGAVTCGFQPEQRTYKPHVTLARKVNHADNALLDSGVIWQPKEFVLAGSHSGSESPRYKIIDRWSI